MAIVDRPTMAPGPSAIQPYLQGQGRRRIEDEIATMLLGINPTDRANMGNTLPGGTGGGGGGFAGTAPGGGSSLASVAGIGGASAPSGLQVGSANPLLGAFGGDGGTYGTGADPVASPDQSLNGVARAAMNIGGFAMNPALATAMFLGTAINNPLAQTVNPLTGYLLGESQPSEYSAEVNETISGVQSGWGGFDGMGEAPGGPADGGQTTGGAELGGIY